VINKTTFLTNKNGETQNMTKFKYTLNDYFYSCDIYEEIDTLKEAYEVLRDERKGDISNISEIYGNNESINLGDYNHDPKKIEDYFDKLEVDTNYKFASENDDLQYDDYIIYQKDKIEVYEYEGSYLGEFYCMHNAIKFIIKRIIKEGHYPSIFIQNSRGNLSQIVLNKDLEF